MRRAFVTALVLNAGAAGGCRAPPTQLDPRYRECLNPPCASDCFAGGGNCDLDCSVVAAPDFVWICGEHDALCANCGCPKCETIAPAFCDNRGSPARALTCSQAGCYESKPCAGSNRCWRALDASAAQCAEDLNCVQLGCTGPNLCDRTNDRCGACGCCGAGPGGFSICYFDQAGETSVLRWNHTVDCFEIDSCGWDTCRYSIHGQPFCSDY